ncbi:RmlC-like cupin domain-containing protein [Cunninghamella echinulata]|nr:RmlC-like cupin domain-containing protein [Cunninghamella echinulata]
MTSVARSIVKSVLSREQMDGVGARVYRSIGTPALRNLDPFLMLDEFDMNNPGAAFLDHPHRGFETVTFMKEGEFEHEDFKGNKGRLGPGDLQWMTAGRGIVHAEVPIQGTKRVHGLQLWVNLGKKDKLIEPSYQEFPKEKVVRIHPKEGLEIGVIAGQSYGAQSPVFTRTPTMFIDVKMKKGVTMDQNIPEDYRGFIYTLNGKASFGETKHIAEAHHTLVLSDHGNTIPIESLSDDCEFVIIAGLPHNEPIVQHGPFVMNTKEEIYQAFEDYQRGQNGFEGAPEFESELKKKYEKNNRRLFF